MALKYEDALAVCTCISPSMYHEHLLLKNHPPHLINTKYSIFSYWASWGMMFFIFLGVTALIAGSSDHLV